MSSYTASTAAWEGSELQCLDPASRTRADVRENRPEMNPVYARPLFNLIYASEMGVAHSATKGLSSVLEDLKAEMRRPATVVAVALGVLGIIAGVITSLY